MSEQNTTAAQIKPPIGCNAAIDAVYGISTISYALDKPCETHSPQMMRNSVRGKSRDFRDLIDAAPLARESPDDLDPIRVAQCLHCIGTFQGVETHPILGRCGGHRWTATSLTPSSLILCSRFCHADLPPIVIPIILQVPIAFDKG